MQREGKQRQERKKKRGTRTKSSTHGMDERNLKLLKKKNPKPIQKNPPIYSQMEHEQIRYGKTFFLFVLKRVCR